jgi:hypothetical protein
MLCNVTAPTKPAHNERLLVILVMCVKSHFASAFLAGVRFHDLSLSDGEMHEEMHASLVSIRARPAFCVAVRVL